MRRFCSTISETFLLLRRDKVFLPIVVINIFITILANLVSSWGTEEYKKILYDIGTAGIDTTGAIIAIFWGTKLIADSKKEGSLELQLAAPVSRSQWVVGKFLGLAATLWFLSMTMLLVWQGFLLVNDIGWMNQQQIIIFLYQPIGWMVLAALAVMLASIATQMTAMFLSLSLWFIGLVSVNIAGTLHPDTPQWAQFITKKIALFWDFQRFNLSEFATQSSFVTQHELIWRASYGLTLSLILVSMAAVLFTRKDVASQ